jgi:glycosyltransferase involved in cell wall biosynthesis
MRILALTNLYPRPNYPTVAAFNFQQFHALSAEHEIAVIAPVLWTEEVRDRISGRRTPARRDDNGISVWHPIYYYPPKILQHLYGTCYHASTRSTFEKVFSEFRPDVLLACYAHPDGWAAVRLGHEAGLPVVLKVVGTDVLVVGRHGLRRARVAEAVCEADRVVAVSRDLAEATERLGADPRRVRVIPEGIDKSVFTIGDASESRLRLGLPVEGRIVLFVGNLLFTKGAGVLIEACSKLARAGEDFRCYLVGRGRDEHRLRDLVSKFALTDRVFLVGARPLSELPDWYRASDVVSLPSFSEGIPNVLREAIACGRPFVASRVGGIPEIADPESSILVQPGSVAELAMALRRILADEVLKAPPSRCAENPRLITWQESARQLSETLLEAIRSRGRPGFRSASRGSATEGTICSEEVCRVDRVEPMRASASAFVSTSADHVDSRLRVLIVTNLYPRPGYETVAPFNYQQFRALATEHDVAIINPVLWTEEFRDRYAGKQTPLRREEEGVSVWRPTYYYPPKVFQHLYGHCYQASIRGMFDEAVSDFHPDVVLGCYIHPDGWAAMRLARRAGLPVVLKAHGSSVLVAGRRALRRGRLIEAVCGADGVVAVSRHLADRIVRLGANPRRVHVVYNGIDSESFRPGDKCESRLRLGLPTKGRMILFVGNLLITKGAAVLIEACFQLARAGEDFQCYLVGRGRDERRMRALVVKSGLADRVFLTGARPMSELPDWYRASDVVALPSFSEGIPNVLREATACGRPFVASRVGGIPEIADPDTSILVKPGSVTELARALRRALTGDLPVTARLRSTESPMPITWQESARELGFHLREAVKESLSINPRSKRQLSRDNGVRL